MQFFRIKAPFKLVSIILVILFTKSIFSQEKYPTKPITFIVPLEAGADGDVLGRAVMERASRLFGQPIIILNKPGAGSAIGYREVHQAKPDGYTLGLASASIITNKLQGMSTIDYSNFSQFGAVATYFPILIASNKSQVKFKTAQEAIAYAKTNPGKVNLATAGIGQSWWVGAQTLLSGANLNMASIPVTGSGANVALLVAGGHAEIGVAGLASSRALLEGGQVRFLATLSENRAPPPYDKLPTIKELGYPVSWESTNMIIGPPNIPKEIAAKIASVVEQVANDPEFMKFAQERDAKPEYIAPDKIIPTMDQRREIVKEIMAKAGLLKETN